MKSHGKLFGIIKLIKDTHLDEVFIQESGQVLMRNGQWLYDEYELLRIAYEHGYYNLPIYPWDMKPKTRKLPTNKFHLLEWGLK